MWCWRVVLAETNHQATVSETRWSCSVGNFAKFTNYTPCSCGSSEKTLSSPYSGEMYKLYTFRISDVAFVSVTFLFCTTNRMRSKHSAIFASEGH